jgi:hypothetical protein
MERLKARLKINTPADSVLPAAEVENGWRPAGEKVPGLAFDKWPLRHVDGRRANFIRYRAGTLTTRAIYETLSATAALPLAQLYSFGSCSHGGAEFSYEISAAVDGEALDAWLLRHQGCDAARRLAGMLTSFLRQMEKEGLRPITLEPSHLVVQDARVRLVMAGALCATDATAFHDWLGRSPLLGSPWTASEVESRHMFSATSSIFSVGQIVAACQFGAPFHHDDLRKANVPFQSIADPQVRRFLMLTLWPYEDKRATLDRLDCADVAFPEWQKLEPGAAAQSFSLGGQACWRAEDALKAAAAYWDEAIERFPELLRWLETTPAAAEVHALAPHGHHSRDWQLVRLIHRVMPDAGPFWRGYALDREAANTFANLAQRALSGDAEAVHHIDQLFAADLRGFSA